MRFRHFSLAIVQLSNLEFQLVLIRMARANMLSLLRRQTHVRRFALMCIRLALSHIWRVQEWALPGSKSRIPFSFALFCFPLNRLLCHCHIMFFYFFRLLVFRVSASCAVCISSLCACDF